MKLLLYVYSFLQNQQLEGVTVAPLALAKVLDSANSADYDSRVEPSSQGGAKMAVAIKEIIRANMQEST
jgi:hypothetical protein